VIVDAGVEQTRKVVKAAAKAEKAAVATPAK
jgi:hypothetical protein